MCGIGGIVGLNGTVGPEAAGVLRLMNEIQVHRGPDGHNIWVADHAFVGLAHRRLSIIDVGERNTGSQPMHAEGGLSLVFNGEIYNYLELKEELRGSWNFRTHSDSETILAAYARWGDDCVQHFRGMFAFALWDERKRRLFCARDPFGIKPFYYAVLKGRLYFASEPKAILPFLEEIETDPGALGEYLTFQYTLGEQTMFRGIRQLMPANSLVVENGKLNVWRYWDVHYDDTSGSLTAETMRGEMRLHLQDSVKLHLRSDVPVGSYLSGGVDSSIVAILASRADQSSHKAFHGRFLEYPGYDESRFAELAAARANSQLYITDITADDFKKNIAKVIYHLDFPVAGPGSFPQFMVSELAAKHVKVVLGGQGGDEMFGGYARYVIAYLEHVLKRAVDGEFNGKTLPVPIQDLLPNLGVLREYKPLMRRTWGAGLFDHFNRQYFSLIDRSSELREEIDWNSLGVLREEIFSRFDSIFSNSSNVSPTATFDAMVHFEFKCLLPALLHVEDRMSMAHGLESRVPLLDRPIAEFAARVPESLKFAGGQMKHILRTTFDGDLPPEITNRRDKMGFTVPLNEWFQNELKDFVLDTFHAAKGRNRPFMNGSAILQNLHRESGFSRKTWGLLSLELWHQQFHDQAAQWRARAKAIPRLV
ncbi:MAG: asparagine synthase (glutamine-hydrolyzing) [Bacteroidota bacterium]|nr:asparagine synthase (glutamine-hydrolyzing) [Bacteroidota bacterium]